MDSADQQHPPGWLTRFRQGFVSGVGLLLIALGCCAIPTFAAWLMPGGDTAPALSALKAAALVLLAGAHGGVVLAGTEVTLAPLLVTGLLGWLVAGHARRQETWPGFAGLALGYAAASAILAEWSRLGSTHAPVLRSTGSALLLVLAVGGAARSAEQLWSRLPARWQQVSRAAAVVAAGYLVAGSLLSAGMLLAHFPDAMALQRQVAPGAAGLPVALLGIAAAPNAVLAGAGYLTGPGFDVGSHTSVSAFSVSSGRLPVFPLLAALPHHRPAPWVGLAVIGSLALLAGWVVLRILPAARSWQHRLADCAAAAGIAGVLLAVLTGLAAGDVGSGALHGVGARWWQVGPAATLVVLPATLFWLGVQVARARFAEQPAPRLYGLASRPSEMRERSETGAPSEVREPSDVREPSEVRERSGSDEQGRVVETAARSRHAS